MVRINPCPPDFDSFIATKKAGLRARILEKVHLIDPSRDEYNLDYLREKKIQPLALDALFLYTDELNELTDPEQIQTNVSMFKRLVDRVSAPSQASYEYYPYIINYIDTVCNPLVNKKLQVIQQLHSVSHQPLLQSQPPATKVAQPKPSVITVVKQQFATAKTRLASSVSAAQPMLFALAANMKRQALKAKTQLASTLSASKPKLSTLVVKKLAVNAKKQLAVTIPKMLGALKTGICKTTPLVAPLSIVSGAIYAGYLMSQNISLGSVFEY